jgi:hypothetical protein
LTCTSGKTLYADLQMATSSRLLVKHWVCSPTGISCYLVPDFTPSTARFLFTIISSPRNFAECLYCDVSPLPILPVLSHFIEFICHNPVYTLIHPFTQHTNHVVHARSHLSLRSYSLLSVRSSHYRCAKRQVL